MKPPCFTRQIRRLNSALQQLKKVKPKISDHERQKKMIEDLIESVETSRNDLFFADYRCYPWENTRLFHKVLGEKE
jgi:hypothetical protein